jgi:ABC-2 type transport system ATP-binding protein
MSTAAVEASNLVKTYREPLKRRTAQALRGVSVRIERGVIFGLLGQNGAGKTTFTKILLSLVQPTSGTAQVLGGSPADPAIRRRIGYLPEQMTLPELMKASSLLRLMGRYYGMERAVLERRIPEVLEQVGLAGNKKPIEAYSKGMRQRLGLAQALLNDPELMFLDEPTEGLDPLGRKQVRDLLLQKRTEGKTILLNSHILSEIEMVCDEVLVLNEGEVVRRGKPADFTPPTGAYRLRVAAVTDAVHDAVQKVIGPVRWEGASATFTPRDRAQLNALLDRLRALPVEIEALEPVRSTLEDYFLELVLRKEK